MRSAWRLARDLSLAWFAPDREGVDDAQLFPREVIPVWALLAGSGS